jgi:hypothetical protein
MKKVLAIITPAIALLTLAPSAFAQTQITGCPSGSSGFGVLCNITFGGNLIASVINILFIIAILIALIYLIWGGIKWIMSGGDKGALQQAREHVIAAIIGLVVVFLAYFIVNFVLGVFGLGTGYSWTLPSFTG